VLPHQQVEISVLSVDLECLRLYSFVASIFLEVDLLIKGGVRTVHDIFHVHSWQLLHLGFILLEINVDEVDLGQGRLDVPGGVIFELKVFLLQQLGDKSSIFVSEVVVWLIQ